jgi:hypothetical protein
VSLWAHGSNVTIAVPPLALVVKEFNAFLRVAALYQMFFPYQLDYLIYQVLSNQHWGLGSNSLNLFLQEIMHFS